MIIVFEEIQGSLSSGDYIPSNEELAELYKVYEDEQD